MRTETSLQRAMRNSQFSFASWRMDCYSGPVTSEPAQGLPPSLPRLPQRQSLVAQTLAILKEEILSGTWDGLAPTEASLCGQLRVSRRTLRAALGQLEHAGLLLRGGRGQPRRVSPRAKKASGPPPRSTVVLLTSEPLSAHRAFSIVWINKLQENLSDAGFHLQVHVSRTWPEHGPERELERLAGRERPAAWVLVSCVAEVQRWFSDRGLPCLVIGSRHKGVDLPSLDVGYRALCRHAAGLLLARGRSRLAFLVRRSGLAGDLESERGFREAFATVQRAGAECLIAHHNDTREGVCEQLNALFRRQSPPTGLLVSSPEQALLTLCFLQSHGLRSPHDVAVISRDEGPFLQYTMPTIARYSISPEALGHKAGRLALQLAMGGISRVWDYRVMPRFVPGETLR